MIVYVGEDAWPVSGAALRERRMALGLTQRDIADACGVTPAAVGAWENETTRPRHTHLQPLMRILQLEDLQASRDRLEVEVGLLRAQVEDQASQLSRLRDDVVDLGRSLRQVVEAAAGSVAAPSSPDPTPGESQP